MAGNGQGVRSRWQISLAVGVLLALAAAVFIYWLVVVRGTVYSDDARIDGDLVDMAPQVSGTLQEIKVREGDRVTKGQLLVQLDPDRYQASVDQSQAQLSSVKAQLELVRAQNEEALRG